MAKARLKLPGNSFQEPLEPLIHRVRGHRVILDAELARVYGVTTKAFNQAVKRNLLKFPSDFAFQITAKEVQNIRAQSGPNRSQIVTGSQKHRDPRHPPWAFTEHGAIMAANVLRSPRAAQMSVYVVRAFLRLRRQILESEVMARHLAEVEKELRDHNDALLDIYYKIEPLLNPPPEEPARRRIGFQKDGDWSRRAAEDGQAWSSSPPSSISSCTSIGT